MSNNYLIGWVIQDKQTNSFLSKEFDFTPRLNEAHVFNARSKARKELDSNEKVIKVGITFETL